MAEAMINSEYPVPLVLRLRSAVLHWIHHAKTISSNSGVLED